MALGIPAQGVVGGLTVLTGLNPYLVGLHLLLSMVLISLAVWLVRLTRAAGATRRSPARSAAAASAHVGLLWVTVVIGTVLTGSGPHAGDSRVPRNGLDGILLTNLHSGRGVRDRRRHAGVRWSCCAAGRHCCCWPSRWSRPGSASPSTSSGCRSGWWRCTCWGPSLAIAAGTNLMLSVSVRRRASRPGGAASTSKPAAPVTSA